MKGIVLYYSQTSVTKRIAEEIAKLLKIDAVSVDIEKPYSGSYQETIDRCLAEIPSNTLYKLTKLNVNLSDYDTVFIGFPIWFGTYARPIMSLLKETDFSGKTLVPFCTFGSGGLFSSTINLKNACPKAKVLDGYGVRSVRLEKMADEVKQFLINSDLLAGEKVVLPDYSAQTPIGAEEQAVFDVACGDYPMPIGKPLTAGKRTVGNSTQYLFTIATKNHAGQDAKGQVFITVESGATEFTMVEREE